MKVKNISKVGSRLDTIRDPFLLAVNHKDQYPEGNDKLEPRYYIQEREQGSDFNEASLWRMYHGSKVPGFPQHPHRGFEVITIVPDGYVDHFDTKGAKGRYGNGDVQLMLTGKGALHSEMFPLIHDNKENPLRLFQVWLNLAAKDKSSEPDYKMLWAENIPVATIGEVSHQVKLKVILGEYYNVKSLGALNHSWSATPKNNVGIALIDMEPNAEFKLEAISLTMNRFLFYYEGEESITVANKTLDSGYVADLNGGEEIVIKSGKSGAQLLLLEGEPINEPVAAYGPFVMNTQKELMDAFEEYHKTEFGGWPWGNKESDMVNEKDAGRFASYDFGKTVEYPKVK